VLTGSGFLAWGFFPPKILFLLALLLAVALVCRQWICWETRLQSKRVALAGGLALLLIAAGAVGYFYVSHRYHIAEVMEVATTEYGHGQYPEAPEHWSIHYGDYNGRKLKLTKRDATHFDFVLEPIHPYIARVEIRDVDVSLMTPNLPEWAKGDEGLRRIALTDRQWNRQQVSFEADSPHIRITGGDGFEKENIYSVELAKNCLNAGLWEIMLFEKDSSGKAMYYQDWFSFPLGHYKDIFEHNTGFEYWRHWYYLEHWLDPAGTVVPLDKLRTVVEEREVPTTFDRDERVIVGGEQIPKRRTTLTDDIRVWGDIYDGREVRFASFIPPGVYSVNAPRHTQYHRMDRFDKAILRTIQSPGAKEPLNELELVFSSSHQPGHWRYVVSGFDLAKLPQLPIHDYPHGFYMPMGIGTPPFHQTYDELQQHPPQKTPYMSVLLDDNNGWIDHHAVGIDGPVMHLDEKDPGLLHVYLLSYERHMLIAHVVIKVS